MKYEKGFTLIELLAVIIVLAIISLIAFPIINNVIEEVKLNSSKSSAFGYLESITNYNALADMDYSLTKLDGALNVDEINNYISYKGNSPDNGYVVIEDESIVGAILCINNYLIKYENNEVSSIGSDCKREELTIKEVNNYLVNVKTKFEQKPTEFKIYGDTVNSINLGNNSILKIVISGKNLLNPSRYIEETGFNFTGMNIKYNKETGIYILNGTDNQLVENSANAIFRANIPINSNNIIGHSYYVSGTNNEYGKTLTPGIFSYNVNSERLEWINIQIHKDSNFQTLLLNDSPRIIDFYINHTSSTSIAGIFTNYQFKIQIEYGNKVTEYEIPKEKVYIIELRDKNNNLINGIGTNEVLEKINNVWGITKNNTFVELNNKANKILNSITLYEGISNIYIDDEITSNITIKYY